MQKKKAFCKKADLEGESHTVVTVYCRRLVTVFSLALGGTREGVPPNQAYPPSARLLARRSSACFFYLNHLSRAFTWLGGWREFVGGDQLNKGFSMIRLLGRFRHPPK